MFLLNLPTVMLTYDNIYISTYLHYLSRPHIFNLNNYNAPHIMSMTLLAASVRYTEGIHYYYLSRAG